MKKAQRQPKRAATWVVRTGAAASPTRAAALTTMPTFRPRRLGGDVSSIIAVMIDQHGPSAKPNSARTSRSSPKLWTIPEIHDSAENRKIAGTSTGRRPNRSDSAPKKKADTAHAIATTEARIPIDRK